MAKSKQVVKTVVVQTPKRKNKGGKEADSAARMWGQAKSGLTAGIRVLVHPLSVVMFIVSLYLFYNNYPLQNFATTLDNSTLLKPVGTFISSHLAQTAGLLWLVPVSFVAAKPAWAFMAALVTGIFTTEYLQAPTKYWEYAFLGASMVLLLKARNMAQFFIAMVVVIITIGVGIWGTELFSSSSSASPGSSASAQ